MGKSKVKNGGNFKVPKVPDEVKPEILESIQRAFFAKNMTYTHHLVYDHVEVPASSNNAKFEGRVQKLSETNLSALN